ncbi:hypothetical protein FB45DRAFT_1035412 [Roridomyces roridus]|uniref:Glycan binding protein Y3-like domain-containing protein n=1 Tax=Roridomyces roridus TaxID=1738132 RepID=A0AAD7BA79_9AGAR|nr:hypothetical protein FB45DRAFT_1035412 [Roridomyces roridus]
MACVAPSVAQVTTVCYEGGTEASCGQFIPTFCNFLFDSDVMIAPGDSITRCFTLNATASRKCDLTALNTLNVTHGTSETNCDNVLAQVNTTCPMGGFGQVTGAAFQFYGDPNTGACGAPVGN